MLDIYLWVSFKSGKPRNLGGGSNNTGAGSQIRAAGSQIIGAGSQDRGAGSQIIGAGSQNRGAGSQNRGAGSETRRDPAEFNHCAYLLRVFCYCVGPILLIMNEFLLFPNVKPKTIGEIDQQAIYIK